MLDGDRSRSNDVTGKLGCGTLILVAIVVAMFSQAGVDDLESEVESLRQTVEELEQTIETQTQEIRAFRLQIDSLIALGSR